MPSISQLEYIVAVDKWRHFAKAAKACHVTQPTLSAQLQKAEDELGIVLFDRSKQPIIPTEQGVRIIQQAHLILREHARLLSFSKESAETLSGEYRLAMIPTVAPYLLPYFLKAFAERYPKVQLKIYEQQTSEIIANLGQDSIDAGILATPLHEQGIEEYPLYLEEFYLYANAEHPLLRKKLISEDDIDGKDLWLLQDGHCLKTQVMRYCSLKQSGGNVLSNVTFQGGTLDTLRYLIKSSGGYTLVPQLFAEQLSASERDKQLRKFAQPVPSREISLVTRRDQLKARISEALIEQIKKSTPIAENKSKSKPLKPT